MKQPGQKLGGGCFRHSPDRPDPVSRDRRSRGNGKSGRSPPAPSGRDSAYKGKLRRESPFRGLFSPLLLSSSHPRPWAMMLHAEIRGHREGDPFRCRGIPAGQIPGFRPDRTAAWIGPGIGPCCYERKKDQDAKTALGMSNFPPPRSWTDLGESVRFDIQKALRIQLLFPGLARGASVHSRPLHSCNPANCIPTEPETGPAETFFVVRCGPEVHNIRPWWEN